MRQVAGEGAQRANGKFGRGVWVAWVPLVLGLAGKADWRREQFCRISGFGSGCRLVAEASVGLW